MKTDGRDWLRVAPSLLLGAGLRLWLATRNAGVTMDSPLYVRMAEAISRGKSVVGPAHHGYSALVALASALLPGRELPGRAVSFAAGLALIPLVYFLARRTTSPRWAGFAALLVALHPLLAVYSGPIMTETTFLAIAAGALLLLEDRHFLAGGFGLGLAYTVRPEALVMAAGATALSRGGRRGALLVLAGFVLVAAPYVGYLSWERGEFTLSPKSALIRPPISTRTEAEWRVGANAPVEPPRNLIERVRWAAPSIARDYLPALIDHAGRLLEVWPWPLMALSVIGLLRRRGPVASPLLQLFAMPALAVLADLRFSQLFVPWLAVFAADASDWLARRWPRPPRLAATVSVALALAGLSLCWTGSSGRITSRFDDGPMRQMRAAGEWLRLNGRPGATVMDRKAYVPFYAGMTHVQLPADDYDTVVEYARRNADYMVLEEYVVEKIRPEFKPFAHDSAFRANEHRLRMIYGTRGAPLTGVVVLEVDRDTTRDGRRGRR